MQFRSEPCAEDALAVRDLVVATGFFNAEESGVAMQLVQARLEQGTASGYEFLFVDRAPGPSEPGGKSLAGYVCYGPIPGTVGSWDLYWIAVAPGQQGHGLGRDLLTRCEDAIRTAGGQRVYIETASRGQYASTRAFYLRNGYTQAALLPDFYAPGDGKLIYVKALSA